MKNVDNFLIFPQNIDRGYTLEPPQEGGSNEYPQSMFWSKNVKKMYTPVHPSFTIQKWGVRGYSLHGLVFVMADQLRGICVVVFAYAKMPVFLRRGSYNTLLVDSKMYI